jgi:hypothetical protein
MIEFVYYLIPYLILLIWGYYIQFVNTPYKIKLFVLFLFLFSALRYDVGYDYITYYSIIENSDAWHIERTEFLEQQLLYLSQWINLPQLFFIVNSFFTILFVYLGINKMSCDKRLSWFVFLCLNVLFLQSMSTVRFHLALALMFWGSTFLWERRLWIFLIVVCVAINIHSSAIITLLFIPLVYIKLNRKINVILFVASFFISAIVYHLVESVAINNLFFKMLHAYTVKEHKVDAFGILPYVFNILNVFLLIFYKRLTNIYNQAGLFITIFNLSCCLMQMFAFNPTLSTRLSRYFFIYIILIIPLMIYIPKYGKILKQIFLSFLIVMYIASFAVNYRAFVRGNTKSEFLPYKTVLFKYL